jgi:hypothetical protein
LAVPLAADVVAREELAEDAAIGEAADAIAAFGELGHFESSRPRALIAVADVDPRSRREGRPRVRIRCRPPSAHAPIVLTLATCR